MFLLDMNHIILSGTNITPLDLMKDDIPIFDMCSNLFALEYQWSKWVFDFFSMSRCILIFDQRRSLQQQIWHQIFSSFSSMNHPLKRTQLLGGGNSNILHFHPDPWGFMIQFDEHIFQMGWFNHRVWSMIQLGLLKAAGDVAWWWVLQGNMYMAYIVYIRYTLYRLYTTYVCSYMILGIFIWHILSLFLFLNYAIRLCYSPTSKLRRNWPRFEA